jgi:predicted Zn-dependent protease
MDQRDRLRRARPLVPNGIAERVMNSGRDRTSRSVVVVLVAAAMLFYYVNSELVPVTGRRRFNFLPDWVVRWKHRRAAADIVREIEQQGGWVLPERDWRTRKVERVMSRLIPVSGMADLDWEVFVIADNATANAFVLPGGKVFVFSGILPLARTDSALAAVLGHEIAHNVADHVGERMSAAIGTNIILYSAMALVGFLGFGPLLMH